MQYGFPASMDTVKVAAPACLNCESDQEVLDVDVTVGGLLRRSLLCRSCITKLAPTVLRESASRRWGA